MSKGVLSVLWCTSQEFKSTPKYTNSDVQGVLGVLRCTSGPGGSGRKKGFSRARGREKYTKVHQVHPDQIISKRIKVHPKPFRALVMQP